MVSLVGYEFHFWTGLTEKLNESGWLDLGGVMRSMLCTILGATVSRSYCGVWAKICRQLLQLNTRIPSVLVTLNNEHM